MSRILGPFKQFFDGDGDPLVDGWLKFLSSGTNNTDKATYADVSEQIPNANPVQLDAEGRCPDVFGTGTYRVVSYTNDLVTNAPAEQIQQKDPVGGDSGTSDFTDWDTNSSYELSDIVKATDGYYYQSLAFNNQDNEPSISPIYWKRIDFISYWNTTITYSAGDLVRYTPTGIDYISLVNTNLNNQPDISTTEWDVFAIYASAAAVRTESDAQIVLIEAAGDAELADITALGDQYIIDIGVVGDAELADIGTLGDTYLANIATEGDAELLAISTSGDAYLADISTEGDSELAQIGTAGDTEIAAVEAEGDTQLAILEDYASSIIRYSVPDRQIVISGNDLTNTGLSVEWDGSVGSPNVVAFAQGLSTNGAEDSVLSFTTNKTVTIPSTTYTYTFIGINSDGTLFYTTDKPVYTTNYATGVLTDYVYDITEGVMYLDDVAVEVVFVGHVHTDGAGAIDDLVTYAHSGVVISDSFSLATATALIVDNPFGHVACSLILSYDFGGGSWVVPSDTTGVRLSYKTLNLQHSIGTTATCRSIIKRSF